MPVAFFGKSQGFVAGLVLEYTGEVAGQYRRVGQFHCNRDYLDKVAKIEPKSEVEIPHGWPSSESYSLEDGYTISII